MDYIKAILIGLVEGVTEWLPVSSTGHMILVERLFPFENMSTTFYSVFLYVIQLAAILAVVIHFFHRLDPFSKRKSAADRAGTLRIWYMVLIGILPAGVIGLLLDDYVDRLMGGENGVYIVAATLILYGVLFVILERVRRNKPYRIQAVEDIQVRDAGVIGLFQCLAIIPGTSRSGSTILGGMLTGVSRVASAEYSFFMAIPIMVGASGLKVGKYLLRACQGVPEYGATSHEWGLLLVASIVAFIVSYFSIKFLLDFVKRHSFEMFGWYRIVLGCIVLLYFSCLS